MKHICATLLLLCNTPELDSKDKFIYEVKSCALHYNSMIEEHDRIPIALVIAQAIHESDWGKSRFAVQGNNLFGVRAVNGENYILSLRLNKKVKTYLTWCESVNDYIELLLTSYHYAKFQKELINQWVTDEMDIGKLVDTLDTYAKDVYYRSKIKKTIKSIEGELRGTDTEEYNF
jgi:uncharacterized FlgJ-related protein